MSNSDIIILFAIFAVFTLAVIDIFWQKNINILLNTLPTLIFYIILCYVLFEVYHRNTSYQNISFENSKKMISYLRYESKLDMLKYLTYFGAIIHFVTLELKPFKNKKFNQRITLFSFCNAASLAMLFAFCLGGPMTFIESSLIVALLGLVVLFAFIVLSNAALLKNLCGIFNFSEEIYSNSHPEENNDV